MQGMQSFTLLSFLICVIFIIIANGNSCENGFLEYESKCFRVVKANATYESAKYICAKVYKGELLRLTSDSEEDLLISLANTVYGITNGLWISNSNITNAGKQCTSLIVNGIGIQQQQCNSKNSFICERSVSEKREAEISKNVDTTTLTLKVASLESSMIEMKKLLKKVQAATLDLNSLCQSPGVDFESRKGKQVINEDPIANSEVTNDVNNTFGYQVKCAAPPLVIQTPKNGKLQVEEGKKINLNCRALGHPKPTVDWQLPSYVPQDKVTIDGEALVINSSKSYQTGQYKCWANNLVGSMVTTIFEVDVLHSPKITTNQSVIHTGTGQKLNLSCVIESNPKADIIWIKRSTNKTLKQTTSLKMNRTFVKSRLDVLIVNSAEDLGVYTCYANNTYGYSNSNITLLGAAPFDVEIEMATEVDLNKFQLLLSATSYCGIDSYRLKFKSNEDSFWMETSITPKAVITPGKQTYKQTFDFPTIIGRKYKVILFAKNEFGWTQSPEFEFNSTYVCGVSTVTASSNWRYIVSHEFYGKYKVPNDYRCETNIASAGGLKIEFQEIEINSYSEYHPKTFKRIVKGSDITVNLYSNEAGNRKVKSRQTESFLTGSTFVLSLATERGTSKGFKARFKKP